MRDGWRWLIGENAISCCHKFDRFAPSSRSFSIKWDEAETGRSSSDEILSSRLALLESAPRELKVLAIVMLGRTTVTTAASIPAAATLRKLDPDGHTFAAAGN